MSEFHLLSLRRLLRRLAAVIINISWCGVLPGVLAYLDMLALDL